MLNCHKHINIYILDAGLNKTTFLPKVFFINTTHIKCSKIRKILAKDHILNISIALKFSSFVEIDLILILCTSWTLGEVFNIRTTQRQSPCQHNVEVQLSHNWIKLDNETMRILTVAHALLGFWRYCFDDVKRKECFGSCS